MRPARWSGRATRHRCGSGRSCRPSARRSHRTPPTRGRAPWRTRRPPAPRRGGSGAAGRHGRGCPRCARRDSGSCRECRCRSRPVARPRPGSAPARYAVRDRRQSRRIEEAAPGTQRVRIAAALGDVFGQRAPGVDPPHIQRAVRQRAESAPAADIGDLEPDALLGADAHHRQVVVQRDAETLQRRDRDETGDHAGRTVEIAAMRHRIRDASRRRRASPSGRAPAASCRDWPRRHARCAVRAVCAVAVTVACARCSPGP